MFVRKLAIIVVVALSPAAVAEDAPGAEAPAAAPAEPAVKLVPVAQLQDDRAGEAFVDEEIAIEGMFYGMVDVAAYEQIQIPKKYRKTHARIAVGGEAGAACRNILVPIDQAGPLYSLAVGTKVRVTGTVDHIISPMMLQPTSLNRMILATKVELL